MNLFLSFRVILFCYINQILTLTPGERREFLDFHNYLRRSVVPTASNMQELEYDENIEKSVYEFLEECKFEHRRLDGYGENGRLASDSNITNTLMSWFQERTFFNISADGDKRCSKENTEQEYLKDVQCGHYKMMVKGSLKSLGCGYKFCEKVQGLTEEYDKSFLTYCFYNSGQMDQPYIIGKPCSDCSPAYQFCKDDLCVPKKRYDKTLRTCQIKCKHCADYFDPKNSCLCNCPDGTNGNSCLGTPNIIDKTCTPCGALGEKCQNGVESVLNENCDCKCLPEYQGEYCEIRKDQYAASYYFIINGINWRYNMMVPVNIVKFKNTFSEFQRVIANGVNKFCTEDPYKMLECKPILENPIISENVLLISGFPKILENGSVVIRMFINFSVLNNGKKQEKYLHSSILHEICTRKSVKLDKFIESIILVNSPDLQYYDEIPQDFNELGNIFHFSILENSITTTSFTEQGNSKSILQNINDKTLSTLSTNIPDISSTVSSATKIVESKVKSTQEYQSTNTDIYSEKTSVLASTSVNCSNEIVKQVNYTSTTVSKDNYPKTTESVNILTETAQQVNYTSTTVSTDHDPKTTEKSANINCQRLKVFIFLQILYIYISS